MDGSGAPPITTVIIVGAGPSSVTVNDDGSLSHTSTSSEPLLVAPEAESLKTISSDCDEAKGSAAGTLSAGELRLAGAGDPLDAVVTTETVAGEIAGGENGAGEANPVADPQSLSTGTLSASVRANGFEMPDARDAGIEGTAG